VLNILALFMFMVLKEQMGSTKKNLTIVLGIAAGAAITAYAVSKTGRNNLKKFGEKANLFKDELFKSVAKDLTKIKRTSNQFI